MRLLATALVCVVSSFPIGRPLRAQEAPVSLDYVRFRLDNGLDVVLHRMPGIPLVSIITRYGVGSGDEPIGFEGFAHLFEHLMFRGTSHVGDGAMARRLVAVGGGANAATTPDWTVFGTWAASHALELALYLDADRMAHLPGGMTAEILERETNVVLSERRDRIDARPYGRAPLVLNQYLFSSAHRYHAPVLGTEGGIRRADLETVVQFFRDYYGPNNATLVLAGDFDVSQARGWIAKWYGAIPSGPAPPPRSHEGHTVQSERRIFFEDEVRETRLYAAYVTPGLYRPGDAALDVLAELLASGRGSLLEDGLTSETEVARSVRATHSSRDHAGVFTIEVSPAAGVQPARVLSALDSLLEEAATGLFPEERVRGTIRRIQVRMLRAVESTGGTADRMAAYLVTTGGPDYIAEDLARFESINPNDIRDAALTFLRPDRRVLLSVVPVGGHAEALPGSDPAMMGSER